MVFWHFTICFVLWKNHRFRDIAFLISSILSTNSSLQNHFWRLSDCLLAFGLRTPDVGQKSPVWSSVFRRGVRSPFPNPHRASRYLRDLMFSLPQIAIASAAPIRYRHGLHRTPTLQCPRHRRRWTSWWRPPLSARWMRRAAWGMQGPGPTSQWHRKATR